MSTTLIADLDEAMKIIFSDPIVTNVVTDSELMSLFKTDTNIQTEVTTGGRYIEMAHYFQLPAGVGARAENEYLPIPDAPEFLNSRVYLRKLQGVVEMTGDVMRRVTGSEGAFIDYMSRALPDLVERLKNEIDRQYIGFGAGIKARVNGAVSGGGPYTLSVDNALGVAGYEQAWLQFLEGESLVFSPNADGSSLRNAGSGQSAKLTNIDEDTNTLTLTGAAGLFGVVADNDYIFAGDASGVSTQTAAGVDREIAGLLAGVDDGNIIANYNNIARANRRYWQGVIINGAASPWNGAMTEDLLVYADDETFIRGGGRVDVIVMNRSALRGYWKSLKSDRFYPDPRSYTGGKPGSLIVMLGDRQLGLKVARKLPPQVVFGLQTDSWRRITLGEWEWDDRTGAIWNRVTDAVGRKDAYYAVGNMYEQLFCIQPRKNFRIDGLATVQ